MGRFAVERSFYLPNRDLMVLTGALLNGDMEPGDRVELPTRLGGPGLVPIAAVEMVQFADGREVPAICVELKWIEGVPTFEPVTLEGEILGISSRG